MKDIYELLNDIDIDEKEFEEMEVNDLEKAKIKNALKISINKKKKSKSWKRRAAVASIIVSFSAATLGLSISANAGNIPVIKDIFRFWDDGRTELYDVDEVSNEMNNEITGLYDGYKEYANEMNLTKESNGIKFTVNDAIFDGNTVSITYSIESNRDLGENPQISPLPKIKGAHAIAASDRISKVAENKYVGLLTASIWDHHIEEVVHINWGINGIKIMEKQEEIMGDWDFKFTLKKVENKVKLVNTSSEKDGVNVSIEKLSVTPMSFIVYYEQEISKKVRDTWDVADVELIIKDDLGNRYLGEDNGGVGKETGFGFYQLNGSKTFPKIDQNASTLIVTPYVTLRDNSPDNYGGVEITETGEEKIVTPTKPSKEPLKMKLEDIMIKLKDE